MSRLIKAALLCAYLTVIYQYIQALLQPEIREEILELNYMLKDPTLKRLEREMKKKRAKKVALQLEIPTRLPTDYKYILRYTNAFSHRSTKAKAGQEEFIIKKCKHINCYLTNDKRLLFNFQYYDAILFDVENTWDYHPPVRSPHQRYVFIAWESAQDNPICSKLFDDYYNLTWTYRLDSDMKWSYFTIFDKNGTIVGPNIDMKWAKTMNDTPDVVKSKLVKKKKVAAWFVSNCDVKSKRNDLYQHLYVAFEKYNMSIDTFGVCGTKQCPKDRMEECLDLVEREYYFYLSFENSICEDYVTEKVLHAFLHYSVPIVYGGANYSRFLPPGSYINAYDESPERVADLVYEAVKNRKVYENYFRWHNNYVYKPTDDIGDVCTLCEMMNTPMANRSVKKFRKWWNPEYITFKADCKY
ncbi:alpha-(1,3)-fucosyltransferase C-like [Plodia interpunctella]|uniref:alpha-(1,3)-fucosyltransferase C-like n=1 Tax=Plodia interpunctella TaxID=58824 RepID=UPI002368D426|nr:alpha-(1,3)-fucosyltransferase C-like [Plodia interpunctella]